MSVTPATLLLIIIMAFVCCLCSLVCINEVTHLNYISDSDAGYVEKTSEDLVIDLSGLYVRSDPINDTINPLYSDCFIDLSQNSDSIV